MSESAQSPDPEDAVREEVSLFLQRNFPQIQAHGGDSSITEVDLEEGHVAITLSGACDGCGVSSMTTEAIKQRLPRDVEAVETVAVSTGFDGLSEGTNRHISDDVPF